MKRILISALLCFATIAQAQTSGFSNSITITRPANATAYGAGDVIGVADTAVAANAGSAILTFSNICAATKSAWVTSADLTINLDAVPAGMTSFTLHLYDASPTAILDNATWDLPAADRASYLGYITVGTPVDVGSTLFVQAEKVEKAFACTASSSHLYGQLVTAAGYTPASGGVYKIRLIGRNQ